MRVRGALWLLLGSAAWTAAGADWPQFRGAGSTGVAADDPRLPVEWSTTKNIAWRVDVPGKGWSSPVVGGGRIYLTTVMTAKPQEPVKKGLYFGGNRETPPSDEHRWLVLCYEFSTGKLLWQREVHRAVPGFSRHLKNSFASETPVYDSATRTLYAYFGNVGVFALSESGNKVWEKRFEPARTRYGWGTAASPVLHDNRLYLVNDNDDRSWLLALDKRTGKTIWQVERDEKSNWTTPFVWSHGGRTEIVVAGTGRVRSYDLDGKVLWEFSGMSSIMIPTPFTAHGLLFVTSGYVGDQNRPVYVVKPGARGDISLKAGESSNSHIAWYAPQLGPYNPSPLVYGDYYYTLYDRGFFACHDARTGKEIYPRRRIDEASIGAYTASPWAYNGKIFAANEDGDTYVIQAGSEYKVLGKNTLDELIMATPAIVDGSLVVRTESKLYRITNQ